jgi:hypothetical protein
MAIKIKQLDRRNTGYATWKYHVARMYGLGKKQEFLEWREWCWETWGPSKEMSEYGTDDLFDGILCSNPHWCWENNEYTSRIYLRGDEEATLFSLKWL